jgi:hypothetical protein
VKAKTAALIKRELESFAYGDPQSGSDVISSGYAPITTEFGVGYVVAPGGGAPLNFKGVSKWAGLRHPHFELIDFAARSTDDNCLIAVLKVVQAAYGLPKERTYVQTLRKLLHIPDGPIAATSDVIDTLARRFGLRVEIITGMEASPDYEREFDDCRTRPSNRNLCTYVEHYPQIIAEGGDENAPLCQVYLSDGHYQYIRRILTPIDRCPVTGDIISLENPPSLRETRARVLAQGRDWHGGVMPQRPTGGNPRKTYKQRIIVYDYETTYARTGQLEPYALGYHVFDPNTSGSDFSGLAADAGAHLLFKREGDLASALTTPLLSILLDAPEDVQYTLVSFNGCRFDHFLLAAAAHEHGFLSTRGIFATSAGIRSIRIGRHTTLDLAKLIPGTSLKDACKSFVTAPQKVEGFSHRLPQAAEDAGTLTKWIADNLVELAEYLTGDVLSLASLFMKLRTAIREIDPSSDIAGGNPVQTAGSLAWRLMTDRCAIPDAVSDSATDEEIRGGITGGRVQVYESENNRPVVIEEPLRMVDFCSLYPTVMAAAPKAASVFEERHGWGLFPSGKDHGEPERVEEYVPGSVGLYRVKVHSQPWPTVLPRREVDKPLDWTYRGEFETQATHTDIELIREKGGSVTVLSGLVWPVARRTLFRPFILDLAAKKNEQDALKAAKSPLYNPALRELYKLLMNSASGKTAQRNYDDCVELAVGSRAQLAAEQRMVAGSVEWVPIGGETCLLIGKKPADRVYKRTTAKPSILAVLIYSYSRALLWKTLLQHNAIYSDTDSAVLRVADYEQMRQALPDLDPTGRSKELGDLEEELRELGPRDETRDRAYFIAPKDYAVLAYDAAGKPVPKIGKLRMKGVNQRSDRLITCGEDEIADLGLIERAAEYNAAVSARSVSLAEEPERFFRERAEGRTLSVLCSQLTRTFKDGDHPFSLEQRFLVKTFYPGERPSEFDLDDVLAAE